MRLTRALGDAILRTALRVSLVFTLGSIGCSATQPARFETNLLETTPALIQNRGPTKASGVFYFVRGFNNYERTDDRFRAVPYFLRSFSEAGWDVLIAKYPHDSPYGGRATVHPLVASLLRGRVTELKRAGYRRVILGGWSWGAWATMNADGGGGLEAEGLFLLVPASHGRRPTPDNPNSSFAEASSDFAGLTKSLSKPLAAVFFRDDPYDPGGRARLIEEHVQKRGLPHVVIDNPSGFSGHGAGWLPVFDYVFGKCLLTFFNTLESQRCKLSALSDGDFRSITHRRQIVDFDARRILTSEELVGRSYAVYFSGGASEVHYKSTHTVSIQFATDRVESRYEFGNNQYCRATQCRTLVRWDDHRLIAFDPDTGVATSWWVEE
jgi:hypothetical protein